MFGGFSRSVSRGGLSSLSSEGFCQGLSLERSPSRTVSGGEVYRSGCYFLWYSHPVSTEAVSKRVPPRGSPLLSVSGRWISPGLRLRLGSRPARSGGSRHGGPRGRRGRPGRLERPWSPPRRGGVSEVRRRSQPHPRRSGAGAADGRGVEGSPFCLRPSPLSRAWRVEGVSGRPLTAGPGPDPHAPSGSKI